MRNIHLIRHGKLEFPGGQKCCIGWTDIPLSDEGRGQIQDLRPGFEEETIEKIYTSPLARCVESAKILSQGRIPIEIVEDMKEIYMGEWEGLGFDRIKELYPKEYEERGRQIATYPPPGGESFLECMERAKKVFENIRKNSRGNVILLSHAGFNRALISELEGRDLRRLLEIPQEYGGVYTYEEPIFDGIIVAAGMSSRMGEFKPLMDLAGKPLIRREIDTLKRGGAREIAVITGNRSEELKAALKDSSVTCLYNQDYAATKMFDSVKIGLQYYEKKLGTPEGKSLDGVFFLPVDVPLFTAFTMAVEKERFKEGKGDVYCPYYLDAPGHPLLIRASAIKKLLEHDGDRGLKGAYEKLGDRVISIDVTDRGTVMDADTREDFLKLSAYEKSRKTPGEDTCRELLAWFGVREDTQRHVQAVAGLAMDMARACNEKGAGLDLDLVLSAALLHDLAKGKKEHAKVGACWLTMLGHERTARIVEHHMDLPEEHLGKPSESLVVYLADKLTRQDQRVSLKERFEGKRKAFFHDPEAMAALERRYAQAKSAEETITAYSGRSW